MHGENGRDPGCYGLRMVWDHNPGSDLASVCKRAIYQQIGQEGDVVCLSLCKERGSRDICIYNITHCIHNR